MTFINQKISKQTTRNKSLWCSKKISFFHRTQMTSNKAPVREILRMRDCKSQSLVKPHKKTILSKKNLQKHIVVSNIDTLEYLKHTHKRRPHSSYQVTKNKMWSNHCFKNRYILTSKYTFFLHETHWKCNWLLLDTVLQYKKKYNLRSRYSHLSMFTQLNKKINKCM